MQFRELRYSPYDGYYLSTFFDPQKEQLWHRTLHSVDELDDFELLVPPLPEGIDVRLRRLMPQLLSPRAEIRAETVHRIAELGESAIPALPWLLETGYYDDIEIHDERQRQTNPRAQAQHALRRLSEVASVAEQLKKIPGVVDPWAPPPASAEPRPRLP